MFADQQKNLIKKYLTLLIQEFIKDPQHQNITIIFKDYLGEKIAAYTKPRQWDEIIWTIINGKKVPGSEKTTHFYSYEIGFLNEYENEEWRAAIVHEFTHLYFFTIGKHEHQHDDQFYSNMERFENWLDENQGLIPRTDKSHDWDQHIDANKRDERRKKICPSCGKKETPYNTVNECFSCHQNKKEFNRLVNLIKNSCNLTELESNYLTVKASSLYRENNKVVLDRLYQNCKNSFSVNVNHVVAPTIEKPTIKNPPNEKSLIWLIIIGGFFLIFIIIYQHIIKKKKKTN